MKNGWNERKNDLAKEPDLENKQSAFKVIFY
jgi:hypothetical protein